MSGDAIDGKKYFRESREEFKGIDENCTQQISLLSTAIDTIEKQECNKTVSGEIHLKLFTPIMELDESWPLQRWFVSWRVHLLMPETLPVVRSICGLTIESPKQTNDRQGPCHLLRKLDLQVVPDLADRLPNLSILSCRVGDMFSSEALRYITQYWVGPHRDSHGRLDKSLGKISLRNLRHARLDFLYPSSDIEDIDQRMPMPELVETITLRSFQYEYSHVFATTAHNVSSRHHRCDLVLAWQWRYSILAKPRAPSRRVPNVYPFRNLVIQRADRTKPWRRGGGLQGSRGRDVPAPGRQRER